MVKGMSVSMQNYRTVILFEDYPFKKFSHLTSQICLGFITKKILQDGFTVNVSVEVCGN
jgi:hypothetical protein